MAERDQIREAPRVQDLIDHYLKEHLTRLSKTNAADQKSMMVKLIAPHWGKNLVTEITKSEAAKLLTKIAEGRARPHKPNNRARKLHGPKPTPVRANRVGEVPRRRNIGRMSKAAIITSPAMILSPHIACEIPVRMSKCPAADHPATSAIV